MEQAECSETLAYKIQTPGNYAKESIQQVVPCKKLKELMHNVEIICACPSLIESYKIFTHFPKM